MTIKQLVELKSLLRISKTKLKEYSFFMGEETELSSSNIEEMMTFVKYHLFNGEEDEE